MKVAEHPTESYRHTHITCICPVGLIYVSFIQTLKAFLNVLFSFWIEFETTFNIKFIQETTWIAYDVEDYDTEVKFLFILYISIY